MVRPPFMLGLSAPDKSPSVHTLKRPQDSCHDNQGLRPRDRPAYALDILKRTQARKILTPEEMENRTLKNAGEDPEADLMAFTSYDTIVSRPAWSDIGRDEYDYVKDMFARHGVTICKETPKADIIKFKEALLNMCLYFF